MIALLVDPKNLYLLEGPKKSVKLDLSPDLSGEWPMKISPEDKMQIAQEFMAATSSAALLEVACSFCGVAHNVNETSVFGHDELDASKLEAAARVLRKKTGVNTIKISSDTSTTPGCYEVCRICRQHITFSAFNSVPPQSYANGTWIGNVPVELSSLTFIEEQCIALARTTKCLYKLKPGPTGSSASRGNVCVLPQEPRVLPSILPPPMCEMYDEVIVVFLRTNNESISGEVSHVCEALHINRDFVTDIHPFVVSQEHPAAGSSRKDSCRTEVA